MSKLREKLKECIFISWDMTKKSIEIEKEKKAVKCEEITDDFATKFNKWSRQNYTYFINDFFYKNSYELEQCNGIKETELLQIFKDNFYE